MAKTPDRSYRLPLWIVVALLLAAIFTAEHGIAGLIMGTVLVPGSHGQYVTPFSDPRTYDLAEVFWLVGAAAFGIAGISLVRMISFRKAREPQGRKR